MVLIEKIYFEKFVNQDPLRKAVTVHFPTIHSPPERAPACARLSALSGVIQTFPSIPSAVSAQGASPASPPMPAPSVSYVHLLFFTRRAPSSALSTVCTSLCSSNGIIVFLVAALQSPSTPPLVSLHSLLDSLSFSLSNPS